MRARRAEIAADAGYVEQVLPDHAKRARAVAEKTMERVRTAVGLD